MTVAYDGSGFFGFAINRGVPTVGGALTEVLERVLGEPVTLTCAGRTDRGVHARGQVVTFDASAVDVGKLQRSLNSMLGPAIAVRDLTEVPIEFDARHTATARRYRYLVLNRPDPDPFLAATSWHVTKPIERWAMDLACDPLVGMHDFSAFCRRPPPGDGRAVTLTRRVMDARWTEEEDGLLRFEIEASAFCHQMVRSIVGTLVDVGVGRLVAGTMTSVIRSRDRRRAGDLAPAHGLTLMSVRYPDWAS